MSILIFTLNKNASPSELTNDEDIEQDFHLLFRKDVRHNDRLIPRSTEDTEGLDFLTARQPTNVRVSRGRFPIYRSSRTDEGFDFFASIRVGPVFQSPADVVTDSDRGTRLSTTTPHNSLANHMVSTSGRSLEFLTRKQLVAGNRLEDLRVCRVWVMHQPQHKDFAFMRPPSERVHRFSNLGVHVAQADDLRPSVTIGAISLDEFLPQILFHQARLDVEDNRRIRVRHLNDTLSL